MGANWLLRKPVNTASTDEAAEARALCRRGKPKGKTKAEQFAEKWPNSIHLA